MSATMIPVPGANSEEQRVVLHGIGYDDYEAINEILGERHAVRLIFVHGRLTLLTASRRREWFAERLAELVKIVALTSGIGWEDAGSATYRRREKEVGVEGDKTFYLGENARRMRGPVNIDLANQPPPDLAIEVEITHPADDALLVYGRLGVTEVWRFDVDSWAFSFCIRREDGSYESSDRGPGLPLLTASDVLGQMRLAESMGADHWYAQLGDWARNTLLPRVAPNP
jgi:Uma2 family endonuclease